MYNARSFVLTIKDDKPKAKLFAEDTAKGSYVFE